MRSVRVDVGESVGVLADSEFAAGTVSEVCAAYDASYGTRVECSGCDVVAE